MPSYKPLVLINGGIAQLPSGDTLSASQSGGDIISVVNDPGGAALKPGMPVYLSSGSGGFMRVSAAKANAIGTSQVIGLIKDTIDIGTSVPATIIINGILNQDWTNVIGTETLAIGLRYYLSKDSAGHMVSEADIGTYTDYPNCLVYIGIAINDAELLLNIELPIAL